ncbi:PEP-CTERM sorting domain-containing protein [Nostoc piscinale]|uniref:PEP-CTERM sorting domain-containing protein n=1 Tax=Nostoc piscinale TaxID=224012 RepID=UPI0039A63372
MKNFGLTNTLLVAGTGAAFIFTASPSPAAVINISDFTEWESIGNVHLSGEQAALFTGDGVSDTNLENFLGLASGTLDTFNGQNVTDGSAIKNTLTVQAGDVLTFDWHFQAGDYLPYNDFSFYSIGTSLNRLADVLQVGNFGQTASRTAYTFTTGGTYTIGFGVVNTFDRFSGDRFSGSNLTVRSSRNDEPVPEPMTIVGSLVAGAFGVALRHKKKQQQKVDSDV